MAVPYTFAGATSSIPLSQLDTNFASTITLGNTAIQLGNTVTTLNNMTLANVTISSGNVTITNVTVTTANVTVGNITTLTGTSATYTNIASGNVTITGGTLNNVAIGGTTAASGAFTTLSASGAFSLTGDQVQISEGGTGQTTANAAFNALAPSQTGNSGKYLKTDGTDTSWDAIDINTADITGTLPILNGGTGQTTANAAFNALAPSQTSQSGKYLKTDGTNASWDALDISTADITGTLPIANGGTGLTALGTGVQTALGQNVTGSGGIVLATSPVLTTPNLGTPSAATLTNATGLPISTGVSGLGTNVATALAVNVGTAGAFVVNGGALGTPSSGTLTNCTGYPTSALSGSINLATQVTGTLATTNGGTGLSSFTANGVVYASSSSVLTTGSALTFDGANLGLGEATPYSLANYGAMTIRGSVGGLTMYRSGSTNIGYVGGNNSDELFIANLRPSGYITFATNSTEQMRLTSTGLGIGTSSPAYKLHISGSGAQAAQITSTSGSASVILQNFTGAGNYAYIQYNGHSGSGLQFYDTANVAARMTLDASGNLGLGVTPSAWNSDYRAFNYGSAGLLYGRVSSQEVAMGTNWLRNAGASFVYAANGFASYYAQVSGVHSWHTAPSGTAGNAISFTQAMTLDASGNLGIGTTSPSRRLVVSGGEAQFNNGGDFNINSTGSAVNLYGAANVPMIFYTNTAERARITSGGDFLVGLTTGAKFSVSYGGNDTHFGLGANYDNYITAGSSGVTIFRNSTTERARITSGGNLLVGTTTSDGYLFKVEGSYPFLSKGTGGAALTSMSLWNDATTGDNIFVVFSTEAGGTTRGSIDYNRAGGLVRYNTTSDYRAKDIIGPVQNTGTTIDALKVYEGVMKGATQARPMMIAHEAQEVVPFCVSGAKDETNEDGTPKYQQMDHASLVPLLIAELQSLRARVAQLEGASA